MDMSKTLSDLPMDLHRLILSHDEEKIELKKENEKLKTRVKMLQCLLDEARQDSDSDEDTDDEDESENEDYECEECGVQVIAADIPENECWSIAYGCLSLAFCKPCYERSWAEHPENPANKDSDSNDDDEDTDEDTDDEDE